MFGVIFTPRPTPTPTPSMILSSLPPVSSSSNLGLIVFVIKHSCTDPSVNPLTPADYMGGRGGSPPTQTGPAALRPYMVVLFWHFLVLEQSQADWLIAHTWRAGSAAAVCTPDTHTHPNLHPERGEQSLLVY